MKSAKKMRGKLGKYAKNGSFSVMIRYQKSHDARDHEGFTQEPMTCRQVATTATAAQRRKKGRKNSIAMMPNRGWTDTLGGG